MRVRIISLVPLAVAALLPAAAAAHRANGAHAPSASAQAAAPAAATRVDAVRLLQDVRALASPEMQGRLAGSAGGRLARTFIVNRFTSLGLQPVNGTFLHPFRIDRPRGSAAAPVEGTNILGVVRGRERADSYILLSAHYDHLGVRNGRVYAGADDNASGVAAMLALAEWFAAHPPRTSILFAAFDAEEQGLLGARHFVRAPPLPLSSIHAVVNMDMIGRGDANTLSVAGTWHYPFLEQAVAEAARGRRLRVAFGHDRPSPMPRDDWTTLSDHAPFHRAGVPFLYFGVEDHADYHKPSDTADRIPAEFFAEATEVVLGTVQNLSEAPPVRTPRPGAETKTTGVVPASAGAGPLTPQEQAIVAAVDASQAEALALLERVVNINSGTMNFAGVRAVGDVFREELESLGFRTRWVDGAAFNRAGHLVAERQGRGPRVLLIGHLDTVFEPDSAFQRFERIDATHARGPGIIDMKGGDVVMIQALKALRAAGALDALDLRVVLTGDEELSGEPLSAARAALIEAAQGADVALGFENGPGNPRTAVIARRGAVGWQLRVSARPGHSSQIFREDIGAGAIYEAARILTAFRETLAGEPHLTFNPGVIVGGTEVELDTVQGRGTASGKENVIAAEAMVTGDLRTLSAEQLARAKSRMQAIAEASLPHARATLTFEEGYPALAPTDGNRALLALYDQASRDIGAGPVTAVDPDRAGAADVSFVAGHAAQILDGIGLMGHSDHSPQETADLATLPSQTKRAALLLHRVARSAKQKSQK